MHQLSVCYLFDEGVHSLVHIREYRLKVVIRTAYSFEQNTGCNDQLWTRIQVLHKSMQRTHMTKAAIRLIDH